MDYNHRKYLLEEDVLNEAGIIATTKILKNVVVIFHEIIKFSKSTRDTYELEEMLEESIPEIESLLNMSGLDPVYKQMIISGLSSIIGIQRLPIVNNLVKKYTAKITY